MDKVGVAGPWVLLSYKVPREPSSPRIAIWRKLKRLGVAQISDGMVALPADARTREQLEWIAADVIEAGGSAAVWLGRPATVGTERELAATMAQARAEEYRSVLADAESAVAGTPGARATALKRLREELRQIGRRDFFPPPERDAARAAVEALADPSRHRAPGRSATSPATSAS